MTTTREVPDAAAGPVPPGDRSMLNRIQGVRWWVSLLIGLVGTVIGVSADLLRTGQLGLFYMIFFPVGCVGAVVWARRREMFGPMVQPPLLLVVAVPVVVVASGALGRSGGFVSTAIAVAGPLINGFPTMAITTAVCLAIAFVRSRLQLCPPDGAGAAEPGGARPPAARTSGARAPGERLADRAPARPAGARPAGSAPERERSGSGQPRPSDGERDRERDRERGVYRVSGSGEAEPPPRPGKRPR